MVEQMKIWTYILLNISLLMLGYTAYVLIYKDKVIYKDTIVMVFVSALLIVLCIFLLYYN
jgi:signal transduction histidine kinase